MKERNPKEVLNDLRKIYKKYTRCTLKDYSPAYNEIFSEIKKISNRDIKHIRAVLTSTIIPDLINYALVITTLCLSILVSLSVDPHKNECLTSLIIVLTIVSFTYLIWILISIHKQKSSKYILQVINDYLECNKPCVKKRC